MNAARTITNTIHINATPEKVWQALTHPSETKKYMFGCETVSDWKEGSDLLWEGEYEGNKMVFVKGKIVEIEPNRKLVYTVIDPNNPAIEDIPENYLTVTYQLHEDEDGTLLTVTQGDYSKVADGERRYKESYNNGEGWNPILTKIKEQVEGIA
jgi:uncharacterized protein YndB with AHSA1/START domain